MSDRTPSSRMLPRVIGGPGRDGMTASRGARGRGDLFRRPAGGCSSLSLRNAKLASPVPRPRLKHIRSWWNTRPRPELRTAGACGTVRLSLRNELVLPRNVHVLSKARLATRLSAASKPPFLLPPATSAEWRAAEGVIGPISGIPRIDNAHATIAADCLLTLPPI